MITTHSAYITPKKPYLSLLYLSSPYEGVVTQHGEQ